MDEGCLICLRIEDIKKGDNPYFAAELKTGYVVLGDHQYYKGYTLFLGKHHVSELHELDDNEKATFLMEMSAVAKAVYKAFHPKKLNYELLGNAYPHLHWHIFPRYETDPLINSPVWIVDKAIRTAESTKPTEQELVSLKKALLMYLSP